MAPVAESVVRLADGSIGLRLVPRERAILRALLEDLRVVVGEEAPPPGLREYEDDDGRPDGADRADAPGAAAAGAAPDDADAGADHADADFDADADPGAGDLDDDLPVDAVRRRLHPDSRPDDPAASERFRDMVRGDLDDARREHIAVVEGTLDARSIDDAQAESWLLVLNDLRLVMGTRLDVTHETEAEDFDPEAPDAAAKIVYAYTGWLEGQFVDVLADALPRVPDDAAADPDEGVTEDDS